MHSIHQQEDSGLRNCHELLHMKLKVRKCQEAQHFSKNYVLACHSVSVIKTTSKHSAIHNDVVPCSDAACADTLILIMIIYISWTNLNSLQANF